MSTIQEIKKALSHLQKVKNCYILHCITQYPCRDKEANLLAIQTLRDEFPGYGIGYSDHTVGCLAPLLAVAQGARVIEKHFTLDRAIKEGTDHILSVEPKELKDMVMTIRKIEFLLGDGKKKPSSSERKIKSFMRRRFI